MLSIKGLRASVDGKQILNGIDLSVPDGKVHAIMGPNGSGKSTLALALMGHPKVVAEGQVTFGKQDLLALPPDERSKLGIFLSYQQPPEIEGLTLSHLLYTISPEKDIGTFMKRFGAGLASVKKDKEFTERPLNVGFSGGEKKKAEVLQMLMLKPKFIILDEIDSGLDVDALKIVAKAIGSLRAGGSSILIITHYARILKHMVPDKVHVLENGRITRSGDHTLASAIEKKGYS